MSSTVKAREVRLTPEGVEHLQSLFDSDLRHRRVFVNGQFELGERERCSLVIAHPAGKCFEVAAEAVYLRNEEPGAGVGLDLVGLDQDKLAELDRFVRPQESTSASVATGSPNIYERIRQLGLREREVMGRQGALADRVALERVFGSSVWEALLQNPQLSAPEVARLAKNGTLPVPLVGIIVSNGAWIAGAEVRRALLGNPRVAGAHLDRVLKAMTKLELKQVANASPYRSQVRAAAKKLLGE